MQAKLTMDFAQLVIDCMEWQK